MCSIQGYSEEWSLSCVCDYPSIVGAPSAPMPPQLLYLDHCVTQAELVHVSHSCLSSSNGLGLLLNQLLCVPSPASW